MILCVRLCMLGVPEGRLCLLEVLKVLGVMRRMMLCTLAAVECELRLLEVMPCVLLCM